MIETVKTEESLVSNIEGLILYSASNDGAEQMLRQAQNLLSLISMGCLRIDRSGQTLSRKIRVLCSSKIAKIEDMIGEAQDSDDTGSNLSEALLAYKQISTRLPKFH